MGELFMADCNAMHLCWAISPLYRQKLMLASAKGQPIWDFFFGHTDSFIYV